MDDDGDTDVTSDEHRWTEKLMIWENDGSGNLTEHMVDSGKESHLGARVADLDGDGDSEMISIAWDDFQVVHLWRNDAITPTTPTLEASFDQSATIVVVSATMAFTDTSTAGSLPIVAWAWDFGDRSPPAGSPNVQHAYYQPGVITVTLVVTDEQGQSDSATSTVKVLPGSDWFLIWLPLIFSSVLAFVLRSIG